MSTEADREKAREWLRGKSLIPDAFLPGDLIEAFAAGLEAGRAGPTRASAGRQGEEMARDRKRMLENFRLISADLDLAKDRVKRMEAALAAPEPGP